MGLAMMVVAFVLMVGPLAGHLANPSLQLIGIVAGLITVSVRAGRDRDHDPVEGRRRWTKPSS